MRLQLFIALRGFWWLLMHPIAAALVVAFGLLLERERERVPMIDADQLRDEVRRDVIRRRAGISGPF